MVHASERDTFVDFCGSPWAVVFLDLFLFFSFFVLFFLIFVFFLFVILFFASFVWVWGGFAVKAGRVGDLRREDHFDVVCG